jgi:hypothetical protein
LPRERLYGGSGDPSITFIDEMNAFPAAVGRRLLDSPGATGVGGSPDGTTIADSPAGVFIEEEKIVEFGVVEQFWGGAWWLCWAAVRDAQRRQRDE